MRRTAMRLAAVTLGLLLFGTTVATVSADEPIPSSVTGAWFDAGQPLQEHHVITLAAFLTTTVDGYAPDATMTFTEVGGHAPTCVIAVDIGNTTLCTIPTIPAGSYHYTVTYSGNAVYTGSVSDPFDLTVLHDSLDATGVGRNYSTFYPRIDGYRDGLTIRGARAEPIAVSIKIYTSAGTRVKSVSKALASGAYAYVWSGRTTSGTILPSGKYRIVQRLTDAAGTTATFTSYAYLSKKVLVTHTTYVTKAGSSGSASGHTGSASVRVSTTGGYAKLHTAGSYGDWAGIGYQFSIPSATIYKSIKFQAYTNAPGSVPPNEIAMQDFASCAYVKGATWNAGCFDHFASIGSSTGARHWSSTTGSLTTNRAGRIVRGTVSVNGGTVYVYRVRVRVVYKTLQ